MNKLSIIIILLIFTCINCSKDNESSIHAPYFEGVVDNELWKDSINIFSSIYKRSGSTKYTLGIDKGNMNSNILEIFRISEFDLGYDTIYVGDHIIKGLIKPSAVTAKYTQMDYDLIMKTYKLFFDGRNNSWLRFSNIIENEFVEGEFSISLIVSFGENNSTSIQRSDTLYFSNCFFGTRIK